MEREDRLFDVCDRTDPKPSSYHEPTFSFWNRSGWPEASRYRDLSEHIFADYPEDRRKDMRRRFRSKKGNQHESALLELLLFAVLRPFNVKVRADTPDFEFCPSQRTYLLEATACRDPEDIPVLFQDILDDINTRLSSTNYYLQVSGEGRLTCKPPLWNYRVPIEDIAKHAAIRGYSRAVRDLAFEVHTSWQIRHSRRLWPRVCASGAAHSWIATRRSPTNRRA